MTPQLSQTGKKIQLIILATAIVYLVSGCNSSNFPAANSPTPKSISQILFSEEDDSWDCIIKGNHALTFSAINHITPTGLLLYFPDTALDMPAAELLVPADEVFSSIEANEFSVGNSKNARLLIGLNMDRPYRIFPEENGLKISFPKTLVQPVHEDPMRISAETDAAAAGEHEFVSASLLNKVTATPLIKHIIVNLTADGPIAQYDSFAIDNPARIVFDIYHIKSPHQTGRTIEVDSKWVKRIRFNPYPNKVRLVLDTEKQYLTKYFSFPTDSGLLIYIGQMPAPLGRNDGN
jgi:type IV pilus assembly protein PilQ